MHTSKRWNLAPAHEAAAELAARLKVSPLVAQILLNRGHIEPDDCHKFLKPTLKDLHDPALIAGLSKAADRVARAIRDREKIVVYGDYDVDGITAVTILWHAIKLLGGDVHYYIPHRIDEGYGLNSEAISQICKDGAKLIITVDCGVTAIEPAETAKACGVDLIVSDHHEWKENKDEGGRMKDEKGVDPIHPSSFILHPSPLLPPAYAIVHPRLPLEDGTTYPNPNLCGAGVAFKLAWGIGQAVCGASKVSDEFRSFLIDATALAALGTIADVVPLVDENRILVTAGLRTLAARKRPGVRALMALAQLDDPVITADAVSFRLTPRLNAAGRLGDAQLALDLLLADSDAQAVALAQQLDDVNRERQRIQERMWAEALAAAADWIHAPAIVVGQEGWHHGVVGIIAARLVDKFARPVVVVGFDGQVGRGSARTTGGLNLHEALTACREHVERCGGHAGAAGVSLNPEQLPRFRTAFLAEVERRQQQGREAAVVLVDGVVELREVTVALAEELERLAPFGMGNAAPMLALPGLTTTETRVVGQNHLQLAIESPGGRGEAIAFNMAEIDPGTGAEIDLIAVADLDTFRGTRRARLRVKHLIRGVAPEPT